MRYAPCSDGDMRTLPRLSMLLAAVALTACSATADETAAAPIGGEEADFGSADLIGPSPKGEAVRYPIVLVHGFGASPKQGGFHGLPEALRADGHKVYVADLPPFQSTEVRAGFLKTTVDQAIAEGALRVNILAHSMGGLDARVLVSGMGYGDRVAVLTTVSTPHHGTKIADAALDVLDRLRPNEEGVDGFFSFLARSYSDLSGDLSARGAFLSLSERASADFNTKHPDDPRVLYQSLAGVSSAFGIPNDNDLPACQSTYYSRSSGKAAYPGKGGRTDAMNLLLKAGALIVARGDRELRPNDGVVTVESARYGLFLGCIPADHLAVVGADPLKRSNRWTGFSHVRFYRNLAFDLARRGY
jgi:triacylglycerol lipase